MSRSKSKYDLPGEIIRRSVAQNWDEAKLEWDYLWTYKQDEPDRCLCGHQIFNVAIIRNRENGNEAEVGVRCVLKFKGQRAHLIVESHKKVASLITRPFNAEAIDHAFRLKWMSQKEKNFYLNTRRLKKKELSKAQRDWRVDINRRVLESARKMQRLLALAASFKAKPFDTLTPTANP